MLPRKEQGPAKLPSPEMAQNPKSPAEKPTLVQIPASLSFTVAKTGKIYIEKLEVEISLTQANAFFHFASLRYL
jgi:hypothetical protein